MNEVEAKTYHKIIISGIFYKDQSGPLHKGKGGASLGYKVLSGEL
jgi:hypothetical protein